MNTQPIITTYKNGFNVKMKNRRILAIKEEDHYFVEFKILRNKKIEVNTLKLSEEAMHCLSRGYSAFKDFKIWTQII